MVDTSAEYKCVDTVNKKSRVLFHLVRIFVNKSEVALYCSFTEWGLVRADNQNVSRMNDGVKS